MVSSDLPYHIVVGMPALSPTMETGILAEWYLSEGAEFSAGEAIAKIETDKASIDFEAQDDGYVAKILMEAGSGEDIAVGTPIMVTVEEAGDVSAFATFVLEEGTPPPAPALQPVPSVQKAAAQAPTPAPTVVAPPTPPPAAEMLVQPPAVKDMVAAIAPVMSTGWGVFAKLNSPILKTLSKQQADYIGKYGTTGQVPL
jgi:pyruvate dehydrogenase E2 component (dihydrolipoamide acetyltransferase)